MRTDTHRLPPDLVTAILPYRLGMQALVAVNFEMGNRHAHCHVSTSGPTGPAQALTNCSRCHHRCAAFVAAPPHICRKT
ncbi:MAG TPA: hypothetical protein PKL10_10110, partial [Nitrospira sp.]|nr:hypothetical protein [Nitrospira sp.]